MNIDLDSLPKLPGTHLSTSSYIHARQTTALERTIAASMLLPALLLETCSLRDLDDPIHHASCGAGDTSATLCDENPGPNGLNTNQHPQSHREVRSRMGIL